MAISINGSGTALTKVLRWNLMALLLVLRPGDLAVEQRHGRDRHLGARVLHLAAVDDVDQRIVLLVEDAPHGERLEDQADALGEDLLAARAGVDVADGDRPGLAAGDRRVRRIDEPVSLGQPVDEAAVEARDMAGHALDLGIRRRLDDDAVAGPVVAEGADLIGAGGKRQSDQEKGGNRCSVAHGDASALRKLAEHTPLPTLPLGGGAGAPRCRCERPTWFPPPSRGRVREGADAHSVSTAVVTRSTAAPPGSPRAA